MFSSVRVHVDHAVVRVDRIGTEGAYEDDACIAVRFSAHRSRAEVLAEGREAVVLPERLQSVDLSEGSDEDRNTRLVAAADAPWWNSGRLIQSDEPLPSGFMPLAHHGEVVIAWPFAGGTFSPALAAIVLKCLLAAALPRSAGDSGLRRTLWPLTRIDLRLDSGPHSGAERDDLVRALWATLPGRVTLHGKPLTLVQSPTLAQVTWRQWLALGVWCAYQAMFYGAFIRFSRSTAWTLMTILFHGAIFGVASYTGYRRWYFGKPASARGKAVKDRLDG